MWSGMHRNGTLDWASGGPVQKSLKDFALSRWKSVFRTRVRPVRWKSVSGTKRPCVNYPRSKQRKPLWQVIPGQQLLMLSLQYSICLRHCPPPPPGGCCDAGVLTTTGGLVGAGRGATGTGLVGWGLDKSGGAIFDEKELDDEDLVKHSVTACRFM